MFHLCVKTTVETVGFMCLLAYFCQIPPDPCCSDVTPAEYQQIDAICISPAEETLAISTDRGQLYSVSLSSVDMNKVLYYHTYQQQQ